MKTVKLGNVVRDLATNLVGTATQIVEMYNGTLQFCVQPKLKDDTPITGAVPDAVNIDIPQLEFVEDGMESRVTKAQETDVKLGNEVEDISTGFRGFAMVKHTFINGCIYFHVRPKQNSQQKKDNKVPESEFISSKVLKVVGKGIAKEFEKELAKPAAERTGGPMTKAMRV